MILISGLTNCKMYLTWKSKSIAALQGKTFHLFFFFSKKEFMRVFLLSKGSSRYALLATDKLI